MPEKTIKSFTQYEYSKILDKHGARRKSLTHGQCIKILLDYGLSQGQANNAAYRYLHHDDNKIVAKRYTQNEYNEILDKFHASSKQPSACVKYLEQSFGCTNRQANSAVYKYRKEKDLVGNNKIVPVNSTRNHQLNANDNEAQRKIAVGNRHILKEVKDEVWHRDKGICQNPYCGSTVNLEIDHIIPFSKGGTNDINNLRLLCRECNRAKHDDPEPFNSCNIRTIKKISKK